MMSFFRKLSWLRQRRIKEDELRDEFQFHLDEEAEQRRFEGLADDEARRAALRDLGNITLLKEHTRAMWSWIFLEQLVQDLRYAARTMIGNRGFTALAALSLALGIGANTTIYSFMDAILLRRLPVPDPASLVVLKWHAKATKVPVMRSVSGSTEDDPRKGTTAGIFPFPAFEFFRKNSHAFFSNVFAYYPTRGLNLMVRGQSELANGEFVSGDYFGGLAIPPAAGRLIIPDDDRSGAPPVAVISIGLSQKRFGGAANAAGQSILINNVPFTVAGVTLPEFFGVDPSAAPDFYLPMHADLLLGADSPWAVTAKDYLDQYSGPQISDQAIS